MTTVFMKVKQKVNIYIWLSRFWSCTPPGGAMDKIRLIGSIGLIGSILSGHNQFNQQNQLNQQNRRLSCIWNLIMPSSPALPASSVFTCPKGSSMKATVSSGWTTSTTITICSWNRTAWRSWRHIRRFPFTNRSRAWQRPWSDLQGKPIDVVVNLAAQAGVRYSLTNPQAYVESNLVGFVNILECCRHHGVKHLVFASSSSVYGANTNMPFSVHHNVDHPVSLYAASKKSNELMAHTYSHLFDLPCTGLRFFTVTARGAAGHGPVSVHQGHTRRKAHRCVQPW